MTTTTAAVETVKIGLKAPSFNLPSTINLETLEENVALENYRGRWVMVSSGPLTSLTYARQKLSPSAIITINSRSWTATSSGFPSIVFILTGLGSTLRVINKALARSATLWLPTLRRRRQKLMVFWMTPQALLIAACSSLILKASFATKW